VSDPLFSTRKLTQRPVLRAKLTQPASRSDYLALWLFIVGPVALGGSLTALLALLAPGYSFWLLPTMLATVFGTYLVEASFLLHGPRAPRSRAARLANLPTHLDGATEGRLVALSGRVRATPEGAPMSALTRVGYVVSRTTVMTFKNRALKGKRWRLSQSDIREDSRNFVLDLGSRTIRVDPSNAILGVPAKKRGFGRIPTAKRQETARPWVLHTLGLDPIGSRSRRSIVVKEDTIGVGDRVLAVGTLVKKPGVDELCLGSDDENSLFVTCATREQLIAEVARHERSWRWLVAALGGLLWAVALVCAILACK
jgi:hypothetical protein